MPSHFFTEKRKKNTERRDVVQKKEREKSILRRCQRRIVFPPVSHAVLPNAVVSTSSCRHDLSPCFRGKKKFSHDYGGVPVTWKDMKDLLSEKMSRISGFLSAF